MDSKRGFFVIPIEDENKVSIAVDQMRGIYRETEKEEKYLADKAREMNEAAKTEKAVIHNNIRYRGTGRKNTTGVQIGMIHKF